jgi:hypothetical protein
MIDYSQGYGREDRGLAGGGKEVTTCGVASPVVSAPGVFASAIQFLLISPFINQPLLVFLRFCIRPLAVLLKMREVAR